MPHPFATLCPSHPALNLSLFSGKGGVGKTTLSCGFARFLAQQFPQESILLLSTDPAHSLGDVLQMDVTNQAQTLPPGNNPGNLWVRSLDAHALLTDFKERYGDTLELLMERGSVVEASDLGPVWDLNWPGLDELMGILEIQRVLREGEAQRVVVDMAPSGHSLNLFGLMDFLDRILDSLDLFQAKHKTLQQTFAGHTSNDEADEFLEELRQDLREGRALLQDPEHTACFVVAIPEPMSLVESDRFIQALGELGIPWGGIFVNRMLPPCPNPTPIQGDRLLEQRQLLEKFQTLSHPKPLWVIPLQPQEPLGGQALDQIFGQITAAQDLLAQPLPHAQDQGDFSWPEPQPPFLPDFLTQGYKLILLGGKGGVGKTTVAAALGWGLARRHPEAQVRVISIDPAHSLGDSLGVTLGHEPMSYWKNLSLQEVDADRVLDQFREDYLWELAEMMSGDGDANTNQGVQLAYGPEAWRKLADQSLPGIDEMLSLITVMELLESGEQDLIILDTAPTGHLLRFLEMPTALADWLGWIFKLWIKYQSVVGRTELIQRLRGLRKQVMATQKKLQDAKHTEFIAVCQNQVAILAETQRLGQEIQGRGIAQTFVVHNRAEPQFPLDPSTFPQQTIVSLGALARSVEPEVRIDRASQHLLGV